MFDELEKYEENDHFFFEAHESLERKCNAPKNKGGVFVVNALKNGRIELVYIGNTEIDGDGLKEEVVNGTSFDEVPNSIAWPTQMMEENIEALDIYWYVTEDASLDDSPEDLCDTVLDKYYSVFGQLPRWNHGI